MPAATLKDLLADLSAGENLEATAASTAAYALADATVPKEDKKAFLRTLAQKGESPEEVAAFASVFRGLASDPGLGDTSRAIDVVGTGGDKSGSFNISTTSSLIVAAAGQPVVKHGNRSITSKCGSADFLEALGIELQPDAVRLREAYEQLNFVFLFAPAYHPAFKEVVPVRKELAAEGQRTVFNLLGPLINPGKPGHLLMGVFAPQWVEPLAQSLAAIGFQSAVVVNSQGGDGLYMDELSCAGVNTLAGVGRMADLASHLVAEEAGLSACSLEVLRGGEVDCNLALLEELMAGKADAGLADTVCLNAGMAFHICGRTDSLADGIALARQTLVGGGLSQWLKRVQTFFTA